MKTKLALILLLYLNTLTAQNNSDFILRIGAAMPILEFANSQIDNKNIGGAMIGVNLGLKWETTFRTGLGLFTATDIFYNSLTSDVRDEYESILNPQDITYSKYINLPLTAGISYRFMPRKPTSVFTSLGLVGNYLLLTEFIFESDNEDLRVVFEPTPNFGFKFSGGIIIDYDVEIEFSYYHLGKYNVAAASVNSLGDYNITSIKQKVDVITLTLGVRF